jgi:voltage-gated potassium channel
MAFFLKFIKKTIGQFLMKIKLGKIIFVAAALNLTFGVLFYWAEQDLNPDLTIIDSIWWAMVTMTTVGYGDFYAQSIIGRFLISYPAMLMGIGIIGYLVGTVADYMIESISKKKRGLMSLNIKDHLVICNFPNMEKVLRLVDEMRLSKHYKNNPFVLITDQLNELPEALAKKNVKFVFGSPLKEDDLHKANIKECSGVFVLAQDPGKVQSDAKTFTTGTIIEMVSREIDKPIKVIVELINKDNYKMMKRSLVDGIVSADGIMDGLLVQEFLSPGVHDIIHQIITNSAGSQFYFYKTKLKGVKVSEIQIAVLKHTANIQVIGLKSKGNIILTPSKTTLINEGDELIILAENRSDFMKIENEIMNE